MFFEIQQSLEVLSVVVYISIQDYGTICVTTFLLHELPPHSSSSIIAGTSHVSWKELYGAIWLVKLLGTSLMEQFDESNFPTSLTWWLCTCLAHTPLHQRCFRSLLCIGTVQGNTDICIFLVQIQLRYLYLLLSHHHSPTIICSCDLAILNTFLRTNIATKASEHQS